MEKSEHGRAEETIGNFMDKGQTSKTSHGILELDKSNLEIRHCSLAGVKHFRSLLEEVVDSL